MLLVLVILSVLAAIVYPNLARQSLRARRAATQAQIRIFRTALASFEIDNGLYPQGRNGLLELMQPPAYARSWHGPYLEALPKDPWGHDYLYDCPGRHNPDSYDLLSPGQDGLLGTDDDITNWDVDKQASP